MTPPAWVTGAGLPSPVVGFRPVQLGAPVAPPDASVPIAPMPLHAARREANPAPERGGAASAASAWAGELGRASSAAPHVFTAHHAHRLDRHPAGPLDRNLTDDAGDRPTQGLPPWWPQQQTTWSADPEAEPAPDSTSDPLSDPGAADSVIDCWVPPATRHDGSGVSQQSITAGGGAVEETPFAEPAQRRFDRPGPSSLPAPRGDVAAPLVQRRRRAAPGDGTRRPVTRRVPWDESHPKPSGHGPDTAWTVDAVWTPDPASLSAEHPAERTLVTWHAGRPERLTGPTVPGFADPTVSEIAGPRVGEHLGITAPDLTAPDIIALSAAPSTSPETPSPPSAPSESTVPGDVPVRPEGPQALAPARTSSLAPTADDLTAQLRRALVVERERSGALADEW